jgi:hypothetical protein
MAVSVFFWARPREIGHQVPGDAVAGVGRDVNFGSLHFGLGSRHAPCSGSLPPRACSKASTAASLSRSITSKLRPVRSPMLARGLAITMPCQTRKDWRTSAGSFFRSPGGDEVRHGEANWGSRDGLIALSFEGIGLFSRHHFDAGPVRAQLREPQTLSMVANRCVGFRTID